MTPALPVIMFVGGKGPLTQALCRTFHRNKYQIVIADEALNAAQDVASQYNGLAVGLDPLSLGMWANALAAATTFFDVPRVVCFCPNPASTSIDNGIIALKNCQKSLMALEVNHPIQVLVFLSHLAWESDPSHAFESANEHAIRAWVRAQEAKKICFRLIAMNVPPQKTPPSAAEIAEAVYWAGKRLSSKSIFVPGGFGTRSFCQKGSS